MSRRGSWLVVLAVAVGVVGACDDAIEPFRRDTQPVLGYFTVQEPDSVGIQFSGCDAEPPIAVDESDDRVEITIADGGGCEPLHHLVLRLEQPLGDRVVVDGSSGQPVARRDDVGDP